MPSKEYVDVTIKVKLMGSLEEVKGTADEIKKIADENFPGLIDDDREDVYKVTVTHKKPYDY
jgi:hypothetical protein